MYNMYMYMYMYMYNMYMYGVVCCMYVPPQR